MGKVPLQVCATGRNIFDIFTQDETGQFEKVTLRSDATPKKVVYSPDGKLFAAAIPKEDITVYDSSTLAVVCKIPITNAVLLHWSPLSTFLSAFQMPDDEKSPNVHVFQVADQKEVAAWYFNQYDPEKWPLINWTVDEKFCAKLNVKKVILLDGHNPGGPALTQLPLSGITHFSMSPSSPDHICIFSPEVKQQPATVAMFEVSNRGELRQVASQSFFRAKSCDISWSHTSPEVLVLARNDTDSTGKSYYGETFLHILRADQEMKESVAMQKDGPVHATAWRPDSNEYAVIGGFMPPQTVLYAAPKKKSESREGSQVPFFSFGEKARNVLMFSPHSRFLLIGGLGSLKGDCDIWDRQFLKRFQSFHFANATTVAWAPDSMHLLHATCSPRLRVDNGFSITALNTTDGSKLLAVSYPELHACTWRPTPVTAYPNEPLSPELKAIGLALKSKEEEQESKPAVSNVYVPPHLRGKGTISLKAKEAAPKKLSPAGVGSNAGKSSSSNKEKEKSKEKEKEKASEATENKEASSDPWSGMNAEQAGKRVRNLRKKLRQIQELQDKGEESLTEEQRGKRTGKSVLEEEIVQLVQRFQLA
jgi:translation initiation factor 2A